MVLPIVKIISFNIFGDYLINNNFNKAIFYKIGLDFFYALK